METIFDIFFEENLINLDRNGLQMRQKRRDIICHLNAIISGCCAGQNLSSDQVTSLAILSAINFHKNMIKKNSNVCLMGKYHNILYIALKLCWEWNLKDSQIVSSLLSITNCCYVFEI